MLGFTSKIVWIKNYIKLTLLDLSQGINIWNLKHIDRVITSRETNVFKLLRLKKQRYESPDINKITDNKTFWKTISPLFCVESYSANSRITLLKKQEYFQ